VTSTQGHIWKHASHTVVKCVIRPPTHVIRELYRSNVQSIEKVKFSGSMPPAFGCRAYTFYVVCASHHILQMANASRPPSPWFWCVNTSGSSDSLHSKCIPEQTAWAWCKCSCGQPSYHLQFYLGRSGPRARSPGSPGCHYE
jgi:hypothetical protein